jgi:hypothetical protein
MSYNAVVDVERKLFTRVPAAVCMPHAQALLGAPPHLNPIPGHIFRTAQQDVSVR